MNTRMVSLAVLISLLCACSTPRLASIKRGEPVAFVVTASPQWEAGGIRNTAIREDAATGAHTGAMAGALVGLSCGPYFLFCMPVAALVIGGGGAIVGAAAGLAESLSAAQVAQLNERLHRFRQSHDLLAELRANLVERGRKHWQVSADTSPSVVSIELQEISLNSTRDERIALVMRVRVSVTPGAAPRGESTQKQFDYVGPLGNLPVWMDEYNDFVETSFKDACQHLAAQIVSELAMN